MNLKYSELDSKQMAVADEALEYYTAWLNHHHEVNEDFIDNEPVRVKREWYFEYGDEPVVILDSGEPIDWYRLMVFRVDPYHDEGGSCVLYCFVDTFDGGESKEGHIRNILQEFDTSFYMILDERKLQFN